MFHLKELSKYRELLWVLTAREPKVRYKQTTLGILWSNEDNLNLEL